MNNMNNMNNIEYSIVHYILLQNIMINTFDRKCNEVRLDLSILNN